MSEQQHCPGFESNKSLSEVIVKCPECGKEQEIFSDELGKNIKCNACSALFDSAAAKVE